LAQNHTTNLGFDYEGKARILQVSGFPFAFSSWHNSAILCIYVTEIHVSLISL